MIEESKTSHQLFPFVCSELYVGCISIQIPARLILPIIAKDSSARGQNHKKPAINITVSTVSQYKQNELYSFDSQNQIAT